MSYCCRMREKFLIGIVSENRNVPTPVDAVDFTDFDARAADGRPVLRAKFCPFCGRAIDGPLRLPAPAGQAEGPDRAHGVVRLDFASMPPAPPERRDGWIGRSAACLAEAMGQTICRGMREAGLGEPLGWVVDVRAARPEDFGEAPPSPGLWRPS